MSSVAVNKILESLTPAQQRQVTKKINDEVMRIVYEQSKRSTILGQKIKWKDILINFKPNKYVSKYEDIWQLESILGAEVIRKKLQRNHTLDARFVEQLFRQSPYLFYINQPETYLFSDYGDLDESDGGPLKQLTALDALQRYGLNLLEQSKEKQYVRL